MKQEQRAHQGLRCCVRETRLRSPLPSKHKQKTYQCTIKSLVSKNTPEYLFIDFSSLKKQTSSGHKAHLFRILQMD